MVSLLYTSITFLSSILLLHLIYHYSWWASPNHLTHHTQYMHLNHSVGTTGKNKQKHTWTRFTLFITDSMFSWFIYIFMISSTCYVTYALPTISTGTRSGQSDNRNKFIMSWIPCGNHTLSKNLTQTPGILIKISLTEFNIIKFISSVRDVSYTSGWYILT